MMSWWRLVSTWVIRRRKLKLTRTQPISNSVSFWKGLKPTLARYELGPQELMEIAHDRNTWRLMSLHVQESTLTCLYALKYGGRRTRCFYYKKYYRLMTLVECHRVTVMRSMTWLSLSTAARKQTDNEDNGGADDDHNNGNGWHLRRRTFIIAKFFRFSCITGAWQTWMTDNRTINIGININFCSVYRNRMRW